MKDAPWFKFYPSDFLGGTAFMSADEVGGYVRLLCHQWNTGKIPESTEQIERVIGTKFTPEIASKFQLGKDGFLRNKRLEDIRKELAGKSDKAKRSAARRWNGNGLSGHANAMRTQCDGNANAMRTHMRTQCDGNANQSQSQSQSPSTNVEGGADLKLDGVPDFPTKDGMFTVTVGLAEDLQRRLEILTAPEMITQFHKAHYWLTAEPGRLKTTRGMPLFFFNWMSKTVEEKEKRAKEGRA